jgi:hypothetical protein
MERHAILIESSDVKGQDDLPGARNDITNWQTYLKSNLGGLWKSNEITVLRKPKTSSVKTLIYLNSSSYCFVAFSGHGFYDKKDSITKVCLNDEELSVSISELKPKGTKGTLVVDTCRGVEKTQKALVESCTRSDSFMGKVNLDRSESALWFRNLITSPNGIVTMYSCDVTQSAGEFSDDPNKGGYYTTILMLSANQWVSTQKNYNTVYTTLHAHTHTALSMQDAFPQQKPQYEGNAYFPFAVKA